MSEHMRIRSKIIFDHLPYDDDTGFAYCSRCKGICEGLEIELNQGIDSDWIRAVCPKCDKTIWVSKLDRERIEDKIPCAMCGKLTNHYDSYCNHFSNMADEPEYVCSERCEKKWGKRWDAFCKTNEKERQK